MTGLALPRNGPPPLEVAFLDRTPATPTWAALTAREGHFGDGGTSADRSATHGYTAEGLFDVSLTVTGPGGSETETKLDYTMAGEQVAAAFAATPTLGQAPFTVAFTDQSSGSPDEWAWSFGDGGIPSQQHPTHECLTPSYYPVSLTASNAASEDTETKQHYIWVALPDAPLTPAPEQWAAHEIIACATGKIVEGYPNGTHRPEYPVTRDQMAVYIQRAFELWVPD